MDLLAKRIEILANLAIIVVAVFLGLGLIKNHLLESPKLHSDQKQLTSDSTSSAKLTGYDASSSSRSLSVGTRLSLPNVEWSRNDQTLVLALSNSCHFCTESAPFYQQLVRERARVRTIAVLPQAISESRKYLESLNLAFNDVKQATLQSIGVEGTPTLILVDRNGAVLDSWVGKLSNIDESKVLSRMR